MTPFILDCSVVMARHFEDEKTNYADRVLEGLKTHAAHVPPILLHEVMNALLVAERKHRTTAAQADALLDEPALLPLDPEPLSQTRPRAMILARHYQLTTYDTAYVELAERRRLPQAALDLRLQAAARAAAVPICHSF
ncbi:MAG: type II toxin-antitoxin system VapC family toxin [Phycisphaerae bacterium]